MPHRLFNNEQKVRVTTWGLMLPFNTPHSTTNRNAQEPITESDISKDRQHPQITTRNAFTVKLIKIVLRSDTSQATRDRDQDLKHTSFHHMAPYGKHSTG